MAPLLDGLFFGGTDVLEQVPRVPIDVQDDVSERQEESDGEEDETYEKNLLDQGYATTTTPAAKSKQNQAELDQRIKDLKLQGYADTYVESKLKEERFSSCSYKTVASRWRKIREEMERLEDEQLDDELTDWHEGEDEMLTIAFQAAEQDFRKHLEKLEEKKWKTVSESVGSKLGRKKYTAKACKERHDGLQDGSADMAIEKDPDQNGRAIKREQRIADAKRRRAEFVEAERMAKEEKARLAAEEKERKLKWRAEIEKYRETRKAEREEDARLKAEKKFGKKEERKSRAAGFRFLRSEAAERAGVREAEERIFNYYTGRDLVRKHANRVKGDYGDDFADSDDDGNADYLRDSDDDDGSGADDASTASYKPKPKKRAVAPAPPKSATVTKVTLRNPRSIMTDDELDVLIFERRLERRGPTEVHPEVVARLAAADATLSSSTLNSLLEKHFEPTKGKRSVRVDRLQKADAANCAAGKNGLDVTDLEFQDTYEGYKGEYAHTITY